ncbi:MAG: c-type cytochrome [Myxococcales bacterium]|nr:c-type cytochrome [Myxococcales bacterium]
MRRFLSALLALATTTLALTACDGDAPRGDDVREWLPSDHQPPPGGAQASAEPPPPDQEPSPEMVARAAAALFDVRCSSCHGSGGQGDGPEAPSAMPDFTTPTYQAGTTDADIARAIRMGQGLMPAFGGQLNERGISALVGHVRSLRAGG